MTELLYRPESEEELYALMPRFLKEDRNTRALIAAACHMVFRFLQAVEHAIVELTDIDRMSEEALDEKAYSLGMLWYDYQADVQKKRMWIAETEQMRRSIGTMAAIARLMTGAYANCNVEEWPEYGGEPYHFRVTVLEAQTPNKKNGQGKQSSTRRTCVAFWTDFTTAALRRALCLKLKAAPMRRDIDAQAKAKTR